MVQITCEQLGGSCSEMIEGNDANEMAQAMYTHLSEEHPDDVQRLTGTSMAMDKLRATAQTHFEEESEA